MNAFRHILPALALMALAACTSTPSDMGMHSAVAANVRTHTMAKGTLPTSTARMTLAISKYNKNEIETPVDMQTTDSVNAE